MRTGVFIDGVPWTGTSAVDDFDKLTGQHTDFVHWFMKAGSPFPRWPEPRVAQVTYEPWEWRDSDALRRNLSTFAQKLAAQKKTTWLRFGHEMNGNWYTWCGDPGKFVANWVMLYDILKDTGAWDYTNMIWCPNETDVGGIPLERYWPGREYVDLIGIDGYNWGTSQSWSSWRTFDQIFTRPLARVQRLSPAPVFVAETGCSPAGGDKRAWQHGALTSQLRLYCATWLQANKEQDWRFIT